MPDPSPLARVVVEDPVATLDPLFARTRSERLVSRQLYEPLTARTPSPLGEGRARRGPARLLGVKGGGTLWRFRLRGGLRFHDGSPLNPDAVIANVDRWRSSGVAAELLPELIAVDSPRPGEVRFQLDRPVSDLDERLDDGRLGLVSPLLISSRGTRSIGRVDAGSGPFELREREGTRLLLARSADWWGAGAGLGPGVERLEFLIVPSDGGRADQLLVGVVDVADELGPVAWRAVEDSPLLTTVGDGAIRIGVSSAVRGLTSTRASQPLSDLWLTELR